MAVYFITGVSGAGKSTLTRALTERGYTAYDTDDSLARWQHKQTGYVHPKSSVKSTDRTPHFLKEHSWNVPRQAVEKLVNENSHRNVYLSGVVGNIDQFGDLFAKLFALVIDEETLKYRLATRNNNDWGKQPHELALTLESHREALAIYTKLGYTIIDACQPVNKVVDDILTHVNLNVDDIAS